MKRWKNITLNLPGMNLDEVSDTLSSLDILSISIIDKRNEHQSDWVDDPKNPTELSGETFSIVLLVDYCLNVKKLMIEIQRCLSLDFVPYYSEEILKDRDWVTYTQSLFTEIKISDSLRIVPEWESDSKFDGKTIIIQPGSGFGTGSHPTTQLCLHWLENNLKLNDSVLDYGSGSGILSIGAKMCGAGFVEGVEIDPHAIRNANMNSKLNQYVIPFHSAEHFIPRQNYTVIIANILSTILLRLAPIIGPTLSHKLVLSGVLVNQVGGVIQAYSKWVNLSVIDELDGWVLLSGSMD